MALTKIETGGIKDDAITSGKIPANAVGSSEIADTAVTLAKLEHGTSSNDGKFLRANNGADPTFETITGTTINNNADNRVITGSGTANTLNGESALTFDGDTVAITRSGNSAGGLSITNTNNTQASAAARLELSAGDNASAIMRMECNGHANEFIADGSGNLRIDDNGTERMRIDSNGQLLVGTSQSSAYGNRQLAVGDVSDANSFIEIRTSGTGVSHLLFSRTAGSNSGNYQGYIAYHQPTDHFSFHTGGGNQRARLDSDGLKFNSDSAAANALDDYEEGTFTPTCESGGFNNWQSNVGKYTKIGRMVNVQWEASFQGTGDGTTLKIGGLPFTSTDWAAGSMYAQSFNNEGSDLATAAVRGNSTQISVVTWGNEATGNQFSGYSAWNIWYITTA